jgi:phosphoserine phosphatase
MPFTAGSVHVFFDFDDTLVAGDSILYWMRFYYARRPLSRFFQVANVLGVLLFLLRLVDSHTLKRLFLWPLAFEKPEELQRLAQAFVAEDLARRFHGPVLERLWSHHLLGHHITVVSASATFYLQYVPTLLPPVELLGTEVIWPKTGLRFPRYLEGNLRGATKITKLRELGYGQAWPLGFAYSDHHHDIPLLSFVEFPTCVFPTPRLAAHARSLHWPIWEWTKRPSPWRRRFHKLGLLLFAAEWFTEAGQGEKYQALRQFEQAKVGGDYSFLPEHLQAMRARVLEKHGDDALEPWFRMPSC